MARFDQDEVQQVLENLRCRFPHATEADALTILEDGERADRADAQYEARDLAQREADLDCMAARA